MTTPHLRKNENYLEAEKVLMAEAIPFKLNTGGKHPKLVFTAGGREHQFPIPSSSSDWRSPLNTRSTLKNLLKEFPVKPEERKQKEKVPTEKIPVIPAAPKPIEELREATKFEGTMFAMVNMADLAKFADAMQELVGQLALVRTELQELKDRPAMWVEPPKPKEPEPELPPLHIRLTDQEIDKVLLKPMMNALGHTIATMCKEVEVSQATICNWRQTDGEAPLKITDAWKRLRAWKRSMIEKHPVLAETIH